MAPEEWKSHSPNAPNLTLETHPKNYGLKGLFSLGTTYRGRGRLPVKPENREFSGEKQSICGPLVFSIILYFIIYIICVNICFRIYYRY